MMINIDAIIEKIQNSPARSAWNKGVKKYAIEIIHNAVYGQCLPEDSETPIKRKHLLNGAEDESHYSWGGCSLIYNGDIAERLCTPSELKKTKNGQNRPNTNEDWLDVQARAIHQAINLILSLK